MEVIETGIYPVRIKASRGVNNPDVSWIQIDLDVLARDGASVQVTDRFITYIKFEPPHRSAKLSLSRYRLLNLLHAAGRPTARDTEELHGVELFAYVQKVEAQDERPAGTRDPRGRFQSRLYEVKRTHNRVLRYISVDELTGKAEVGNGQKEPGKAPWA